MPEATPIVQFVPLDWLWTGLFVALMIACGAVFHRLGKRSEADFHLAGRGLPWWLPVQLAAPPGAAQPRGAPVPEDTTVSVPAAEPVVPARRADAPRWPPGLACRPSTMSISPTTWVAAPAKAHQRDARHPGRDMQRRAAGRIDRGEVAA